MALNSAFQKKMHIDFQSFNLRHSNCYCILVRVGHKYAITDKEGVYFITFATIGWIDVFTRKIYNDILI